MTSGVAVTVALMPVVAVAVVLVLDLGRSAWQQRKRDRVFFHVQHPTHSRRLPCPYHSLLSDRSQGELDFDVVGVGGCDRSFIKGACPSLGHTPQKNGQQ